MWKASPQQSRILIVCSTLFRLDLDQDHPAPLAVKCLGGFDELVVGCDGSESSFHVCVDELKAVDIAGVNPSEAAIALATECVTTGSRVHTLLVERP